MDLISEFGFDFVPGRAEAFQRWLAENEPKLSAACPGGVEHLGTYAAIHHSEKRAGGYRALHRLDGYGAQDSSAAAMQEGGEFARLQQAFTEFLDFERDAGHSNGLLKRVTDAVFWEPQGQGARRARTGDRVPPGQPRRGAAATEQAAAAPEIPPRRAPGGRRGTAVRRVRHSAATPHRVPGLSTARRRIPRR